MKVTHTFQAIGRCPANGLPDYYTVEVSLSVFRQCEDIVSLAEKLLVDPCWQEDFTQSLATALCCQVVTTCRHLDGGRVLTRCECGPVGGEGGGA